MGCSTSVHASSAVMITQSSSSLDSIKYPSQKTFGKVSILNGDGSIVTTGTIVPVGQRMQSFGRIRMTPELQIKSHEDGANYDQAAWIAKYNNKVKKESVYASDPVAAQGYAQNVQKALEAAHTPRAPQTPRPRQIPIPPVQKTVFGFVQPPPSSTPLNLAPLPFKLDLPPLPPMITPSRLL